MMSYRKAEAKLAKLAKGWQRCRPEDLPRAFYAYDSTELHSERVVTYGLKPKQVRALTDGLDAGKDVQLIVHLGLYAKRMTRAVPTKPAFTLFLEARQRGAEGRLLELKWDPNGRFSSTMTDDTNSLKNAIPAASAFLFVHSWMETPEAELAAPFTAKSQVLGQRVRAYVYSVAESRSILADMNESGRRGLRVHLGNGLAVWDHPFSFRPVLDVVGGAPKTRKGAAQLKRLAGFTGLIDDGGNSYYDYSRPIPPHTPRDD